MKDGEIYRGHVLLLPYPAQGHINPIHQFAKRLASKGIKATIALTKSITNSISLPSSVSSVDIATISDGYDEGGYAAAGSIQAYLDRFKEIGSKTLVDIITENQNDKTPIDCIVYDSFLSWVSDVAKHFSLYDAIFFTQNCSVNYIYHLFVLGLLDIPVSLSPLKIPGLPQLEPRDMPSFFFVPGQYPAYFDLVLKQYSNINRADFALVNTFHKLENELSPPSSYIRKTELSV